MKDAVFFTYQVEKNGRIINGDPGEARTLDNLIKSQALYQLSYRILQN